MKATYILSLLPIMGVLSAPVIVARDTDNDLIPIIAVVDKHKRSGHDTDYLRIIAADDNKVKRDGHDTDYLRIIAADDNKIKRRGDDVDNLVLHISAAADDREELVSPYTDDVDAADPKAVLGE